MKGHPATQALLNSLLVCGFSLVLLLPCLTSLVQAAGPTTSITGNTVSGNFSTQIIPPPPGGKVYGIQGGQTVGTNLFHSFGQFNVGAGDTAQFQTSNLSQNAAISNILGRINGQTSASQIFGTIDSATYYPAANLFLMNPHGFLFGPTATVNVGGMVAFTSADYLRLQGNGNGIFYADAAKPSVLTTAPVAAFGFLGSDPGAITVQGSQLTVNPGQSLSLVGGNITVQSGTPEGGTAQSAKLSAPGGQINLASVASPGEVIAGTLNYGPNVNGQSFGTLGSIGISEQSVIDVSGNGGGTVLIRGGQFILDNSTISANITGSGPVINGAESIGSGVDIVIAQEAVIQNGALIDSSVVGNATSDVQYGGVHVKADHVEVRGIADFETFNFLFTNIQTNTAPLSTGNSGNIILEGNSILLKDAAQIQSITNGAGNSGNITLKADKDLNVVTAIVQSAAQQTFDGTGNIITRSSGDSGNIELTSAHGNISITGQSNVTSQTVESPGIVGNITMNAQEGNILMVDSGFFTYMQPPLNVQGVRAIRAEGSGEVRINANNMQMNGGTIDVINLSAQPAGDLRVTITGKLTLGGGTFFPSHIQASSVGLLDGSPGASSAGLNVKAHDIIISEGSSINTDTTGPGAAGSLNISAVNLEVRSGGKITSSSRIGFDPQTGLPVVDFPPTGPAGSVNIQGLTGPAQSVLIDGAGSTILTKTEGTGAGGSINISTNSLTVQNGGTISAATSGTAPSATGGTITVNGNLIELNNQAQITATSSGPGNAGTITLTAAESIALLNNSSITSDAGGAGNGGRVSLTAPSIEMHGNSNIGTNTAGTGNAGSIQFQANQVSLIDSFITARTQAEGQGGNISIRGMAGEGSHANDVTLSQNSQLVTETIGDGVNVQGAAGNIRVDTARLNVSGASLINSSSRGSTAGAGNITVEATDGITISGFGTQLLSGSTEFSFGDAGHISVSAPSVIVENGGSISTITGLTGNAGTITVNTNNLQLLSGGHITSSSVAEFPDFPPSGAAGTVTIKGLASPAQSILIDGLGSGIFTDTQGTGAGGNISVNSNSVALQNGGVLSASTSGTAPSATGGTITVNAEHVALNSQAVITADTNGIAPAGTVDINTGSLAINSGGQIQSSSGAEQSLLRSAPTSTGGTITVEGRTGIGSQADSVTIDGAGSGIFTQSSGNRPGGDINILTSGSVTMTNSSISASSTGAGNAGSIQINAGNLLTMTSSQVTTQAEHSSGGIIKITTNPSGTVQLDNSTISASVLNGTGGGGSVNIDPQYVILQNNSQITANAVSGPGGNISITTNLLLPDATSTITASSQFGQQGTVIIQSPVAPASGKIVPLGQKPLMATALLSQRCAALANGNLSSFTVAGRDSLPAEPDGWLSSPLPLATAELVGSAEPDNRPILSLRRIAPPGFLIQSFAGDLLGGCAS